MFRPLLFLFGPRALYCIASLVLLPSFFKLSFPFAFRGSLNKISCASGVKTLYYIASLYYSLLADFWFKKKVTK